MRSTYKPIFQLAAVLLVVLAVSPLTAPFSTCDPVDKPHQTSTKSKAGADGLGSDIGAAANMAIATHEAPNSHTPGATIHRSIVSPVLRI